MWSLAKKIINLAGDKAGNIKASIASSFFYALFAALPYMAIYYFFVDLMANNLTGKTIAIVSGILLVSLLGGVVMKIITYRLQAWSGNYAAAKQRLDIGDRLKRVPMGFFNEKSDFFCYRKTCIWGKPLKVNGAYSFSNKRSQSISYD